jgi:hypothetical protein
VRIYLTCSKCGEPSGSVLLDQLQEVDIGELTEDGIATGKCPNGHELQATVQAALYVLLFDSACLALLDGYAREAVASFAAAVERFHEFAVRVICRHRGMEDGVVERTWRLVGARSEAQDGAFVFLYSVHRGTPIEGGPNKTFRNAVIHKGKLPTMGKAKAYGEDCYAHILDVTDELQKTAKEALTREGIAQFVKRANKSPPSKRHTTIGPGTSPVAAEYIREKRLTFDEALTFFGRYPMWVRQSDRIRASDLAREAGVSDEELLASLRTGHLVAHIRLAAEEAKRREGSENDA